MPTDGNTLFIVVVLVAMVGFMWFSSRQNKKRTQKVRDFRESLAIGQEVMTVSGLVGTIVEVDAATDSVVLDSEGSRSRWLRAAISERPPAAPVYEEDKPDDAQDEPDDEDALPGGDESDGASPDGDSTGPIHRG